MIPAQVFHSLKNKSLAATIPSQLDSNAMYSEDAVHNGTRDWPSSFGSSGEVIEKLMVVFLFH